MAATSISGDVRNEFQRRHLFDNAMQGKWKEVVHMCRQWAWLGGAKITKGGNTALHMAVSDRQERVVKQLVEVITVPDFLETKNNQGNTPLHLAASIGNVSMCECIPSGCPHLVGVPNEEGDTPLFLAARHGKMDAFFHLLRRETKKYVNMRNNKGETVLHCAINGGHFRLAFQIIERNPDLISTRNEQGATPLHVLASKPGAFRSGTHLSLLGKLIYHCVLVQKIHSPLTAEDDEDRTSSNWFTALWNKIGKTTASTRNSKDQHTDETENIPQEHKELDATENLEEGSVVIKKEAPKEESRVKLKQSVGSGPRFPPNYHTCFSFISLLNKAISGILCFGTAPKEESRVELKQSVGSGPHFPPNYHTCFSFISLLNKASFGFISLLNKASFGFISLQIKAISGILFLETGLNYIHKIMEKTETNIWSVKVMERLLELQKDQSSDYNRTEWNHGYAKRTTLYRNTDAEKESKPQEDQETSLPDLAGGIVETSQSKPAKGDGGILEERQKKEGSSQKEKDGKGAPEKTEKGHGSSEEAESTFTIRLGKAGLRADQIIAAKKLIDELCKEETKKKNDGTGSVETPILIAAKNGIAEIVKKILEIYPIAIHDTDFEGKNIVLLAVENRHPHVYELLLKRKILKDTVFGAVDNNGCSALHLAARLSDNPPWLPRGAALQMQWEVMWYEYVKRSMPPNFFPSHNDKDETAKQIFTRDHQDMAEKGNKWLTKTASSCSVVATLIATVAFATSTAVPGGTREGSGKPNLGQQPVFHAFAISSLISLCFSVTSTIQFLAIVTTRYQERDFGQDLPTKLLLGLTSLFISILSILVTFCAGHFFVLRDELRIPALPVYAATCLPAACFAVAQLLPLYTDLIWVTWSKVPHRWVQEGV